MLRLLPAAERGVTRLDWLDSRHTFSFGEYHAPDRMGVRALRVLNDDRVRPSSGFGRHPHRDMEIVSLVLSGSLQHSDSLGNGSVIRPSDVQRMTAGTGIVHSEWNPSADDEVRFLQVWLVPRARGRSPGYAQAALGDARNEFRRVVSGTPGGGPVDMDSDADIWHAVLDPGRADAVRASRAGAVYVHVARGAADVSVAVGGERFASRLAEGDGAELRLPGGAGAADVRVEATGAAEPCEVLVFDLG